MWIALFYLCMEELSHPFVFASLYGLTVSIFLAEFRCPMRRLLTDIPAIWDLCGGSRVATLDLTPGLTWPREPYAMAGVQKSDRRLALRAPRIRAFQ
jgi:hypothetical protein